MDGHQRRTLLHGGVGIHAMHDTIVDNLLAGIARESESTPLIDSYVESSPLVFPSHSESPRLDSSEEKPSLDKKIRVAT
jgi:hypothetical protein